MAIEFSWDQFLEEIVLPQPETGGLRRVHAEAIWAMFDYVILPTCHFKGWGHYYEQYVKEGRDWKN